MTKLTLHSLVVAFAIAGFSGAASAAETPGFRTIDSIHASDSGMLGIYLKGLAPVCPDTTGNALWLNSAVPNSKLMVELVYAAYLAQRPVALTYTCGADGRPSVGAVRVFL